MHADRRAPTEMAKLCRSASFSDAVRDWMRSSCFDRRAHLRRLPPPGVTLHTLRPLSAFYRFWNECRILPSVVNVCGDRNRAKAHFRYQG